MEYYGVIGNRDFIKIEGEKRPFWEFLDRQPSGWLTSLIYRRDDFPKGKKMIWDCGAWSYRKEDIPQMKGKLITAKSVLVDYEEYAPEGSIVIAPDHMLIDGWDSDGKKVILTELDLKKRRKYNRNAAKEFLSICPKKFKPMAAIHGQNISERIKHAKFLLNQGYKYLAIGGIAARASQKVKCQEIVKQIRQLTEGKYLHVLGLSSPEYYAKWKELGVNSCDGSSHFKQAFTGGAFFTRDNARLVKHQAAREGESIMAPHCDCKACDLLRKDGVDTRRYGSNETNMGRAAHNLNVLLDAHNFIDQNPNWYRDKQLSLLPDDINNSSKI